MFEKRRRSPLFSTKYVLLLALVLTVSVLIIAVFISADEPEETVVISMYSVGDRDEIAILTDEGYKTIGRGNRPEVSSKGQIAYTSGDYNFSSIEIRNSDGSLDTSYIYLVNNLYSTWGPKWSPSGELLAVTSNVDGVGTILVLSHDFEHDVATNTRLLGWYDENNLIVEYDSDNQSQVYLVNINTETQSFLFTRNYYALNDPVVKNGLIIYEDLDDNSIRNLYSVWPSYEPTMIVSNAMGAVFSPVPDVNEIAYVSTGAEGMHNGGVWIANHDGSDARLVYRTEHESSYHGDIQWTETNTLYFVTGIAGSASTDMEEARNLFPYLHGDTLVSIRTDGTDFTVYADVEIINISAR